MTPPGIGNCQVKSNIFKFVVLSNDKAYKSMRDQTKYFSTTVGIGDCDYHLVTNIGYCDYFPALIWFSDIINSITL